MRLFAVFALASFLYGRSADHHRAPAARSPERATVHLTIAGTNLGRGSQLSLTLPATFTPIGLEKPATESPEWKRAPRRSSSSRQPNGTSECTRSESKRQTDFPTSFCSPSAPFRRSRKKNRRPGSLPHQNDSIEKAQTIPSTSLTLNGTLKGPERDVYRLARQSRREACL